MENAFSNRSRCARTVIGRAGEEAAAKYLVSKGYNIRLRNYRAQRCEIDIVATEHNFIIFIEVKTRSGKRYGSGAESVSRTKKANIKRAATEYLLSSGSGHRQPRFDVVCINLSTKTIDHIKNAF